MSVLIETSLGDIVIDLFYEKCPLACTNFIKLCKIKFYNHSIFHMVEKDYLAKVTHIRTPPTSLNQILYGNQAQYFEDEINKDIKFNQIGLVATANNGPNMNNSDFFITLTEDPLPMLDEKHTIFGVVAEGLETLSKINLSLVDDQLHRPFKNIRIHHTLLLSDPFKDPEILNIPSRSPSLNRENEQDDRIEYGEAGEKELEGKRTEEEIIMATKEHQSKTRAIVLSMLNDIPDPDIKPPDNVLFVCKLNPVTSEKDLELIFSRFGEIKTCEVIRDWKTGNSLQYAFIEFETDAACEEAYFKMENTLIDERRIHVDFSQSVAKLWNKYRHRKYHAQGLGPEGQIGKPINDGLRIIELKSSIRPNQKNFKMVFDEEPLPNQHFKKEERKEEKNQIKEEKSQIKEEKGIIKEEENKNPGKDKDKRRSRSREKSQHHKQFDQTKINKEQNKQGKDKKRKQSKSSSPSSSSDSNIISYKSQSSSSLNSSDSNSKSRSHSKKKNQNQNKKKH